MKFLLGIFLYIFFTFSIFIALILWKDYIPELIDPSYFSYFFYGIILLQIIFFFISGILVPKIMGLKKKEDRKVPLKIYFIITPLFIFTSMFLSYITSFLWEVQSTQEIFFILGLPLSLLIASCLAYLEEKVFREVLQGNLTKYIWAVSSIFISSFIFAMLHNQGIYNIPIFLLGLFLGYIYYKYKSLKLNIVIHVVNNMIGVILLFTFSSPSIPTGISSYIYNEAKALDKIVYSQTKDPSDLYATLNLKYNILYFKEPPSEEELLQKKEDLREFIINWGPYTEEDTSFLYDLESGLEEALKKF